MNRNLLHNIIEIDNQIQRKIIDPKGKAKPVLDGIVEPKRYFSKKITPIKMLWILKEAHIDEKDKSGTLDMRKFIRKDLKKYSNWKRTFEPIIYITWGVLNGFKSRDQIDDIDEKNQDGMIDILKSIAFINLKKIPGKTISWNPTIEASYVKDHEIILKQIELYNPDVVICGGTMFRSLCKDLKLPRKWSNEIEFDTIDYIVKNSRIYISAYHPNQRVYKKEKYCNDIINVVKNWAKEGSC